MPVNNAYGAVVLGMDTDAEQSRDFIVSKTGWKQSRVS